MNESITIDLPAPTPGCSPNSSGMSRHWRRTHGARREYKAECEREILRTQRQTRPVTLCTMAIEWHMGASRGQDADGRYHPRDEDNARGSLKGAQDALVEMGILYDDSRKVIKSSVLTFHETKAPKGGKRPPSFVRYIITPIEQE